jgi:hypothetical protein
VEDPAQVRDLVPKEQARKINKDVSDLPPVKTYNSSVFLSSVAKIKKEDIDNEDEHQQSRTMSFMDRPVVLRDERLAIIEDLRPGPREFEPLPDDPDFKRMEPNSRIYLRCVPIYSKCLIPSHTSAFQ